jgi:hypothetical protein
VKYRGCSGAVGGVRPNSMLTQARLSHLDRVLVAMLDRPMDKLLRLQLCWSKKKQRPGTPSHELPGHCERSEAISFGGSVAPGSPRRLAAPRDDTVGFMPRGSARPVRD